MKPRIVFTTPVLDYPLISRPALRIANSIKVLASVADVCLHCRSPLGRVGVLFYARYCAHVRVAPSSWLALHLFPRIVTRLARTALGRELVTYDGLLDLLVGAAGDASDPTLSCK